MLPKNFCISLLGIILVGLCLHPLNGQTKQEKEQEVLKLVHQADNLSQFRRGKDALAVAKRALKLAKEADFALGEAKASYEIANAYYELNDDKYMDSIDLYAKGALTIAKGSKDTVLQGDIYNQLGRLYNRYKLFFDAARYYEQALIFRQKGGDSLKIATIHNNISSAYLGFGQVWEANENADSALLYLPRANPSRETSRHLARFYINYSNVLGAVGDSNSFKKAIDYSWAAIKTKPRLDNSTLFEAYYGLGKRHNEKGDYLRAAVAFKKALIFAQDQKNKAMTLEALAVNSLSSEKFKKMALDYISEAERESDNTSLAIILTTKGEILSTLGKYRASNEVFEKAKRLLDTIPVPNHQEVTSRIEINTEKNRKSLIKRTRNLLIVGGTILIILFIFLRLEARVQIAEAKFKQGQALIEAARIKEEADKIEKEFIRLIHVAIKGDLGTLRHCLELAQSNKRQLSLPEIIERINAILKRFEKIKLPRTAIENFGKDVASTAKNCLVSNETKFIEFLDLNEAKGSLLLDVVYKELEIITSLAFTNIDRHAPGAKKAVLIIEAKNQELLIEISDDGEGFDMDQLDESKTLGLQDIKYRVKEIGGQCFIDSKIGSGTVIKIKVTNPYV